MALESLSMLALGVDTQKPKECDTGAKEQRIEALVGMGYRCSE